MGTPPMFWYALCCAIKACLACCCCCSAWSLCCCICCCSAGLFCASGYGGQQSIPCESNTVDRVRTHHLLLLVVVHLSLRRTQMLHCVCIRVPGPGRHARHNGGGVHLRTRTRYAHVSDELVWHASRRRAGLARIVGHSLSHRMAWRRTWVLLHPARMRRKRGPHTSHHLQTCRLSTAWIPTATPPRYRIRSSAWVEGVSGATGDWRDELVVTAVRKCAYRGRVRAAVRGM